MFNSSFSIIIPAHNEEKYIEKCLKSILNASQNYKDKVEIIVVLNRCTDGTEKIAKQYNAKTIIEDEKNLAKIRNSGIKTAKNDIIVTIDADSWMSENMLFEIEEKLLSGNYIGGGVNIKPERFSLGLLLTGLVILFPIMLFLRISAGLFWGYKKDFLAIGGFNENLVSAEDIDFALRLKKYGKTVNKKFKTLFKSCIFTSCRKADIFGDWFVFLKPKLVWQLSTGKNRKAANLFYYDVKR